MRRCAPFSPPGSLLTADRARAAVDLGTRRIGAQSANQTLYAYGYAV